MRVCKVTTAVTLLVGALTLGGATAQQPNVPGQKPQLGNGFLATFANSTTEFLGGLFNGAFDKSTRAGLPASTLLFPSCALASNGGALADAYPFDLDSTTAQFSINGTGCTGGASYRQTWIAPQRHRNLLVSWIEAEVASGGTAQVPLLVEEQLPTLADFDQIQAGMVDSPTAWPNVVVSSYHTLVPEYATSTTHEVVVLKYSSTVGTKAGGKWTYPVGAQGQGLRRVFTRISVTVSTIEYVGATTAELIGNATIILEAALNGDGVDGVIRDHRAGWQHLWAHRVDTDSTTTAAALRGSSYAIMCSVRADWPFSTSPGGLPTDGFNGHSFWDESTWVFPNLNLLHPDIAYGSGIRYRLDRLDGAKINARTTLGMPGGAAFPWESAFTGQDVCPARFLAHTEIHITADVVLSIRQYSRLLPRAQRLALLREVWPVLNETARFWAHRTTAMDGGDGPVSLKNVTGPDEYHDGDNEVYTNYAVQTAVTFALETALELDALPDILDVAAALKRILTDMVILYNATGNYHPEYEGYSGQDVKQADVILLNYPLMMPMNVSTVTNDLNYYSNRTSPDRSGANTMTWTMFAVGYLSVLQPSTAAEFLKLGYVNNCFPPYWHWYEAMHAQGNDNFITGAGGFLQSYWAGFISMRVVASGLLFTPATMYLPEDASFVSLVGVHVFGAVVDVVLRGATAGDANPQLFITLTATSTDGPLCVMGGTAPAKLSHVNDTATLPKSAFGADLTKKVTVKQCRAE